MRKTGKFYYFKDENVQVLRMDYKGGDAFMAFILPVKRCGLDELLQSINGNSFIQWIKNASRKWEVEVYQHFLFFENKSKFSRLF